MYTDRGLIALSTGCPELTRLDLYGSVPRSFSDKGILSFADHCHKLESIRLVGSRITSRTAFALLKANPNLTSISLGGPCLLNGEVLLYLALHCRKLLILRLLCPGITTAVLTTLFTRCSRLETLQLWMEGISDALIETIIHKCKLLSDIELHGCPSITELTLAHLFRLGKHLTRIYMEECGLSMTNELSRYYSAGRPMSPHAGATIKPCVDLYRSHRCISWLSRTPLLAPSSPSSTSSQSSHTT